VDNEEQWNIQALQYSDTLVKLSARRYTT